MCMYISSFFFFLLSESSRLKYRSFLSECCLQQCQQYSCSLSADAIYFLLRNLQHGRTELYISGGRNTKRLEASCVCLVFFFFNFWWYFENQYKNPSLHLSMRMHNWDARCQPPPFVTYCVIVYQLSTMGKYMICIMSSLWF